MEVSGQLLGLTALPLGEIAPSRGLGGPQSRSGRWGGQKNLALAGNRNSTLESAASHYTY
jgi:hypothetical protein